MKLRVISALIIIALFAAVVVFNHSFPLALNIAVATISFACVYEIAHALGVNKHIVLTVPSLIVAGLIPFSSYLMSSEYVLYCLYYFIIFLSAILYHKHITFREIAVLACMSVMVPSALNAIIMTRALSENHGMFYAIIAIVSAWIPDVGAFLCGSLFGKRKLCPQISPKKTVEGFVGGIILSTLAMVIIGLIFSQLMYKGEVEVNYLIFALLGAGGAVVSTVGDLSFSLIKRSCHVKDFGHIIPGHGGILDRFDSVIFTAPFVYILVSYLPLVI